MAPHASSPEPSSDLSELEDSAPSQPHTATANNKSTDKSKNRPQPTRSSSINNKAPAKKATKIDKESMFDKFLDVLSTDEEAARHMYETTDSLKHVVSTLLTNVVDLRGKLDQIAEDLKKPVNCSGCLPTPPVYPPSPDAPEDAEERKRLFWFKSMWENAQKDINANKAKTKSASTDQKKEDYEADTKNHSVYGWMVDENGVWHKMTTLEDVLATVRAALITLEEWGKLGQSFTLHSGIEAKVWIVTLLEALFPWLAKCHGHWKALYLAQHVSHGFFKTLRKGSPGTDVADDEVVFVGITNAPSTSASGIATPAFAASTSASGTTTPAVGLAATTPAPTTLKRKLNDVAAAEAQDNGHPTPPATTGTNKCLPRIGVNRKKATSPTVTFANPLADATPSSWSTSRAQSFTTPAASRSASVNVGTPWAPTGPVPPGAPPTWDTPTPAASVVDPALHTQPSFAPSNGESHGDDDAEDDDDDDDDDDSNIVDGNDPFSFTTTTTQESPFAAGPQPPNFFNSTAQGPPGLFAGSAPSQMAPPPGPVNWGDAWGMAPMGQPKKKGRPEAPGKPFAFADWQQQTGLRGDMNSLKPFFEKAWTKLPSNAKAFYNAKAANPATQPSPYFPAAGPSTGPALQYAPPNAAAGPSNPAPKKKKKRTTSEQQ